MISWTDNGNLNNAALSILLKDGNSYYVSVRAVDQVGNASEVSSSNGVTARFYATIHY